MNWKQLTWEDTYPAISDAEMTRFLEESAAELPSDFQDFYMNCHGGMPLQSDFRFRDKFGEVTSGIGRIFPCNAQGKEIMTNNMKAFNGKFFPFAETGGGDLICLELAKGGIYYWNHEQDEFSRISDSLSEFFSILFIPDDVKKDRGIL